MIFGATKDMAWQLRVLTAPAEDPGSIPRWLTTAYDSACYGSGALGFHGYMHTYIHISNKLITEASKRKRGMSLGPV